MAAAETQGWRMVDEGWGRRAVEFATLSEPANCREYVALHQHLGVGAGDRLLDVACGAGPGRRAGRAPAAPPAPASTPRRGWSRWPGTAAPEADLRVGDMHALPWEDEQLRRRHQLPRHLGHHARRARRGAPGARARAAGSASPSGGTSRPRPARGRCRRSRWPTGRRSRTRPRWWRWAGPGWARSCSPGPGSSTSGGSSVPFAWEFADPPPTPAPWRRPDRRTRRSRPSGRRRSGVRRGAGPGAGPRGAAAAGRDRRGRLPGPQARRPRTPARSFLRETGADPRGAAGALRGGRRRPRLRDERLAAVGAPARRARRAVRACCGRP